MAWSMVKSIQSDLDMRLVLPFGLGLRLGDVISVDRDASFTLEGNCQSLLREAVRGVRQSPDAYSVTRQSGSGTSYAFRAAGTASSLFPQLPHGDAGFDIGFKSAQGWILAFIDRRITAIDGVDHFRAPILDAYARGVWKPEWALVTEVATVDKITLLASKSNDTHVALTVNGSVSPSAAPEIKLTANASIMATNSELIQCITDHPSTAFCRALRVKDPWWSLSPQVEMLSESISRGARPTRSAALEAGPETFWETIDEGLAHVKR